MTYLSHLPALGATPARVHMASANRKLAPQHRDPIEGDFPFRPRPAGPYCSDTYVSIEATCHDSCTFKAQGCYVRSGITARASALLDEGAERLGGEAVIEAEAALLRLAFGGGPVPQDGARGGRDLRLHVGGDTPSTRAARVLARAARDWHERGGGAVWTYTHRWWHVRRAAWGPISVLASVEDVDDARKAIALGYVPAIVVPEHPGRRAFRLRGAGRWRWLPCPAETTEGVTCVTCRLCLNSEGLRRRKTGIAFALHGRDAKHVSLPVLR